jgi:DNA repair exonuclease SbcCD ATPase subunit
MTLNEWTVAYYLALGWTPEPAMFKAASMDGFKREHKAASDKLWSLKKLRGADSDPALKKEIADIEELLKKASEDAEKAADAVGVDKATEKLKDIEAKAKAAKQEAKTLDADFAKDLESMPKYLATLETARRNRDTIAGLLGAKAHLGEMDKLLLEAQALITKNGTVSHGYTAGLEKLAGHEKILKDAQKASKDYKAKALPDEVTKAYDKAKEKLDEYRKVGPEFQTKLYEKELADAAESGRDKADRAVKTLKEISKTIKEAEAEQKGLKGSVQKELDAAKKLLKEIRDEEISDASFSSIDEKVKQAEAMAGDGQREYQQAIDLLNECDTLGQSILDAYKKGGKEWETKAKIIPAIKKKAEQIAQWPLLMSPAMQLLNDTKALEKQVSASRDYAKASDELDKLVARQTALEADAKKKGMPEDPDDLKKYADECDKATKELQEGYKEVFKKIQQLEARMEGVKNPKGTAFHKRADGCWEHWNNFIRLPTAEEHKNLKTQKKTTKDELNAIGDEIEELLKKTNAPKLKKINEELKDAEEAKGDIERPQRIQNLLSELKKFNIAPAKDVESEANKVIAGELDPGYGRAKQAEEKLAETLANAKQELEKKQNERNAELKDVKKGLKKVENRNFKAYAEQLDAQADDIQGLIDSGDPDLLELAVKEMEALKKRRDALDPKNRPKDAKTFDEVEKKHAELAGILGKGNLVMKRLPDTYARLRDKLESTLVEARESDPDTGWKAFEPLEKSITAARDKAEKEDFNYQHFKEYKKLVEARWNEITKLTNTWITDRTKSYEARFKTRLAEANKTAHEEGKVNEAIKTLAEIKDELEEIAKASNPRQALQEKDVAADREQKFVIDMVRQFQATLEMYEKKTLVELRKALKGVEGADTDQLDSLEKVGTQAERIVEPYLNITSKLPHKSLSANSAPPMDKAKEDFAMAHKLLEDATRTANSLKENPEGVNVKFTGDLKRIGEEWIKATTAYAAAVKSLGGTIKEAGNDQNGDLKKKCDEVGALLEADAPHFFNPKAFVQPLDILTKKENGAGDRNALLAAREKALRTVRRYRKEILSDPLLVKINSRDNPFEPLTRKAGAVRATLKRLELELLGAV